MIRNNTQLQRATARLEQVNQEIKEMQEQLSGIELEIFMTALVDEANNLKAEIEEYRELQDLSLEEAIRGPLCEPILLDNIGELLTKLRIAANLTQQELGDRLDWQQSNLSRFESENYHSQTIAKIIEYASSLEVWLHVTPSLSEEPVEIEIKQIEDTLENTLRDVDLTSTGSDEGYWYATNSSYTRRSISPRSRSRLFSEMECV